MRKLMTGTLVAVLAGFTLPVFAADGQAVYDAKCKMCHTATGKGSAAMAKMKKVDPSLLDLTTEKNKKRTDDALISTVRTGQGAMSGIPKEKVSDDDLKAVIAYLRTLQK